MLVPIKKLKLEAYQMRFQRLKRPGCQYNKKKHYQ